MKKTALAVAVVCALAQLTGAADAKPRHHHRMARADSAVTAHAGNIIGGRPAGCPHAYCGCAAARFLGLDDKRLNLAWNWTKFYHGPTPVAVWRHHIAIIERMTGPHTAILRDYNSGRGLSRIHERSIAGARIVGRVSYAANQ